MHSEFEVVDKHTRKRLIGRVGPLPHIGRESDPNYSAGNNFLDQIVGTVGGVIGSRLHKQLRPLISCSSGSACSNGSPSHVLLSLGRTTQQAEASLRLSVGRSTTLKDVDIAVQAISNAVRKLRG